MEAKHFDTEKIETAVRMLLEAIGEDPNREGLLETPERVARAMKEIFGGLGETAEAHLQKSFEHVDGGIVVVKDMSFYSMCEHHLLPFWGKAHIAYLPNDKVAGLSKLARTVETYARKPQLQERLTKEIAEAMMTYLGAKGVLVVVEGEHMCMNMRGVQKPGSKTVTSIARGALAEDTRLLDEAYRMLDR
ncbi:GTP cyclohydrolase I FolE [Suicoccus acidiformans]|uniref:GTP cyclohydrolase 1 n=1 Tax=Suicoccus acidiformans TaxID=2036206 RepID=A0A347WM65_9LACT|nr:GTP cyclohydrolase I FolE [Suicoccus acidiformans]AXY26172.1 GTP cyclohydrolase I FolE [Suicoccus acidiformans]